MEGVTAVVKHIVLWSLKDAAHGNRKHENARMIKEKLEALRGVVPGLQSIEVGVDFSRTDQSLDIALCCVFDSREALQAYQEHPAHKAAVAFIREARRERCVVDYEV
jgi:heme-degrading monooxygenase HmoA